MAAGPALGRRGSAVTKRRTKPGATALNRIQEKIDEIPAARRKAIEVELAKIERRAEYNGAKRGRKWTHTQVGNLIAA
jgi:hypothetical protein